MVNLDPPGGRPWALFGLCGLSLLLNIYFVGAGAMDGFQASDSLSNEDTPTPTVTAVSTPEAEPAQVQMVQANTKVDTTVVSPLAHGLEVATAKVKRSLPHTFKSVVAKDGEQLSAIYARLFHWDLDLRKDLQKGDEVATAYKIVDGLPQIQAASYKSAKLGQTLTAVRFLSSYDPFPSYWRHDGTEVPARLKDGPLKSYDQITALLKDRPKHKGMDFKTPVGTPVYSPKAALVTRVNWNTKYNGGCLELLYGDGVKARVLHLSRVDVKIGDRLEAGQQVALSGNTGRSTAPHLHYEMDRGGKVVDPVDYHGTFRRSLPTEDMAAFHETRERLSSTLTGSGTDQRQALR